MRLRGQEGKRGARTQARLSHMRGPNAFSPLGGHSVPGAACVNLSVCAVTMAATSAQQREQEIRPEAQGSDLSPDSSGFTKCLSSYIRGGPVTGPWIKSQLPLSPDSGPGSGLRKSSLILPQWVMLSLAPAPTRFLRVSLPAWISSEQRSRGP